MLRYVVETRAQGSPPCAIYSMDRKLMVSQVDDEVGFIRFFRALPVKEDDTIRIFDRGDWYTSHGDDAAFIARTVE